MKKFIFLFVVFFCHSLITFAQSNHLNLERSPGYKLSEPTLNESGISSVFKVGNEYVAIRNERAKDSKKAVFFLEVYDANLEVLESVKVLEMADENDNSVLSVSKLGDSFLFITEKKNNLEKEVINYAQLVAIDTYQISKKIELFSSSNKEGGKVSVQLSPNGEILLASIHLERSKELEFKVLSSDLSLLYQKKLTLEPDISELVLNKVFVTDDAEIIVSGKATDATGNRALKSFFKLYVISEEDMDSYDFDKDINSGDFSTLFLTQNKEGNLVGGGYFYVEQSTRLLATEEYLFTFDINKMAITHFVSHEFSDEIILEGMKMKKKQGNDFWDP